MILDKLKISAFFDWFSIRASQLEANLNDVYLLTELDKKVLEIGYFDWELGPYDDTSFFLAISPNLDKNRLQDTRDIISLAKECQNWTFLNAKPAKGWLGNFEIQDDFDNTVFVDATNWKYVLYKYEDELEIDVLIDNMSNMKVSYLALDVLLTNLLGEQRYMDSFVVINIIHDLKAFDMSKSSDLSNLGDHLDRLKIKLLPCPRIVGLACH